MKKITILAVVVMLSMACGNATRPAQQTTNAAAPATNDKPQTAIAHSSEKQTPAQPATTGDKSKWSQGGDPIDTRKLDDAVAAAQKELSGKPSNAKAQKALADAYFARALALTDARQYASALGDYRRATKLDPTNTEAKGWIDKIIMIYDGLKKSYPPEGEEPPPLEVQK